MEGAIPHSLSELWLSVHLDGTLLPANDNDDAWKKRDVLVKLWLYGILMKDLFKSTFKTGGTSREIWIRLENFSRNNKEAWPIQLDHKLRTKEIGDLTIHSYCQELKSIADLLANVDASVTERTLATEPFSRNENTAKTSNCCILWQCECCLPLYQSCSAPTNLALSNRHPLCAWESSYGRGASLSHSVDTTAQTSSPKVLLLPCSQASCPVLASKNQRSNCGRVLDEITFCV